MRPCLPPAPRRVPPDARNCGKTRSRRGRVRCVRRVHGFASLGRADEMRFSIDHSVGVVKVQSNDSAA